MTTSPLSLLKDPTLLKTNALVNGQWVTGSSRFAVTDPATGAHLAEVANLGPAEAEAAIAAANAAWPAWRGKTAKERSTILRKWFDLLMAHQDDLGRIMTAEQGKPLPEAKGEVAYGATLRVIMASGKFHGVMAAHTPMGVLSTIRRRLLSNCGSVSPLTRLASSAYHSTKLAP